ncbi:hypothetical protein Tco_1484877 [Tanacetum coccineum]
MELESTNSGPTAKLPILKLVLLDSVNAARAQYLMLSRTVNAANVLCAASMEEQFLSFPSLSLIQGGRVSLTSQLLQSGSSAVGNRHCHAHGLHENSITLTCLMIICFPTYEEVARSFWLPFLWRRSLLDF